MALPLRDDHPARRTPWVTYGLILVNILVFLFLQPPAFQQVQPDQTRRQGVSTVVRYEYKWGVVPCEIRRNRSLADGAKCSGRKSFGVSTPQKSVWLSLLTSLFLHAGVTHIAGNMLFLWVFGKNVEDRFGPLVFLVLYLVAGVAGSLVHVAFHANDAIPVLGASGAIAGVMGAYLVLRPRGRILAVMTSASLQVVYVPAFVILGLFFVTQFLTPDTDAVAWQAHVGGMVAGALLALALRAMVPDRTPQPLAGATPF